MCACVYVVYVAYACVHVWVERDVPVCVRMCLLVCYGCACLYVGVYALKEHVCVAFF